MKTIMESLYPRVCKTRLSRKAHSQAVRQYQGRYPVEELSRSLTLARERTRVQRSYLRSVGRRLDLIGLLRQRKADKKPVWSLASLYDSVGRDNGGVYHNMTVHHRQRTVYTVQDVNGYRRDIDVAGIDYYGPLSLIPDSPPAIPDEVRKLITPKVLRRARKIMILYKATGWHRPADPAIVVEWASRPGVYSALAVWGHDRHQIAEFVS